MNKKITTLADLRNARNDLQIKKSTLKKLIAEEFNDMQSGVGQYVKSPTMSTTNMIMMGAKMVRSLLPTQKASSSSNMNFLPRIINSILPFLMVYLRRKEKG